MIFLCSNFLTNNLYSICLRIGDLFKFKVHCLISKDYMNLFELPSYKIKNVASPKFLVCYMCYIKRESVENRYKLSHFQTYDAQWFMCGQNHVSLLSIKVPIKHRYPLFPYFKINGEIILFSND